MKWLFALQRGVRSLHAPHWAHLVLSLCGYAVAAMVVTQVIVYVCERVLKGEPIIPEDEWRIGRERNPGDW